MLPLATQNSLLVVWLVPFQVGFPPTLFQALAGRTACQEHHNITGPILTIEKLFCSSSFYIIRNPLRKGGGAPGHFTFCIEFWENTQYLSSKKMFKAGAFLALSKMSDIEFFAPYRFRVPFCAQNGALVTGILIQSP